MTAHSKDEGLEAARRIVAWDDSGRLADDEWLVERNETAIIAICRALLSSSAAERRMREALSLLVQVADDAAFAGNIGSMDDAIDKALSALSARAGEEEQEQTTRGGEPTS